MNKKKEVRRLVAEAFQNLRENKTVTPSNTPWCIQVVIFMNDKDILNKFGATLMASVRDRSVCKIEHAKSGALKGPSGKMLHDLFPNSIMNNKR